MKSGGRPTRSREPVLDRRMQIARITAAAAAPHMSQTALFHDPDAVTMAASAGGPTTDPCINSPFVVPSWSGLGENTGAAESTAAGEPAEPRPHSP